MSQIILKKWEQLRKCVIQDRDFLDSRSLLNLLLDWMKEIKEFNDIQIQNLYKLHFSYYENLNIDEIFYENSVVWYSLEEIIQYDIIQANIDSDKWAIENSSNIIYNLLVFKSDRECPCCHDDNLRVLVEINSERLIFECDSCLCAINEDKTKYNLEGKKIIPVAAFLIKAKGINPSPI